MISWYRLNTKLNNESGSAGKERRIKKKEEKTGKIKIDE